MRAVVGGQCVGGKDRQQYGGRRVLSAGTAPAVVVENSRLADALVFAAVQSDPSATKTVTINSGVAGHWLRHDNPAVNVGLARGLRLTTPSTSVSHLMREIRSARRDLGGFAKPAHQQRQRHPQDGEGGQGDGSGYRRGTAAVDHVEDDE